MFANCGGSAKFRILTSVLLTLFLLISGTVCDREDLPEPFLLGFGPDKGDVFGTKAYDHCSEERFLDRPLVYSGNVYTSLYVCMHGFISFGVRYRDFIQPDFYNFDDVTNPVIAPFFADIGTWDNLLDSGCAITAYDTDIDNFYPSEGICGAYSIAEFRVELPTDYITDQTKLNAIREHNATVFNGNLIDKTFDDELTIILMGQNTTKYPNLGANFFWRETTALSDLDPVQNLIRQTQGSDEFEASWAFVATWYKVNPLNSRLDAFDSFQAIIVCNETTPDDVTKGECYVIFDYYELQWTFSRTFGAHARSFFKGSDGWSSQSGKYLKLFFI